MMETWDLQKKHGHGFASKNMYLEIAKSMQKNSLEGRMAFGNAPERKSPAEGKINVEGLQESGKQEVYWRYFACGKKAMSSMWKTGRS